MKYPSAFDSEIVFESYGVRVKIQATDPQLLIDAEWTSRKALLDRLEILESREADHTFSFESDAKGTVYLFLNG
ncbi:MAG: hypothetical protein ABIO91_00330, partial [Pyrinomonadaceae bacterium]